MKKRRLPLGAPLIALYCAAWIALAPVPAPLHQVLSSDGHVFCLEREWIADHEYHRADANSVGLSLDAEDQVASDGAVPLELSSRPACPLSEPQDQLSSPEHSTIAASVPLNEQVMRFADVRVVHVAKVIRFAPKNSPPLQYA